ncbi:hypothetical protein QFC19_000094 [Naganishia cerealis]|uniref:Uncharacterized protein n=1 Tax=Naganishia cerealis TaxID=610337 RepID=A0ACC2WRG9_9TREE|nr:hypothetical protein QFC19_000094 [Naganishia cerealis]
MHRPISNHPLDMHAAPRVHLKFLNEYPVSRAEAASWKSLLSTHADDTSTGMSAVATYDKERESVIDVSELEDVFDGREPHSSWDRNTHAFQWTVGHPTEPDQPVLVDEFPRFVQLKLPSQKKPDSASLEDWLCMLPSLKSLESKKPLNDSPTARKTLAPADPLESMHSLDHLKGGCLYHRAGWFTYAYCHGSHVRQFREVVQNHPQAPGWIPTEDPNHEAYDLGVSPATIQDRLAYWSDSSRGMQNDPDLDLQLAGYEWALSEQSAAGAEPEIELVQNSQGRYLVQKWSGGTICDMTGRPRRIEIQFHCRMGGVDEISSIKEIATCQYLLTVHSPHLCSLPGFHIPTIDDEPSRPITCREIVDDDRDTSITAKYFTPTTNDADESFPRGYPVPPHGAQWHAHYKAGRNGGRVVYDSMMMHGNEETLKVGGGVVVIEPGPKKRKSAKAAEADRMDDESRKAWLAEQRAIKIATREKLEAMQAKIKQARQEMWEARWDVRLVRKAGWILGLEEEEYRDWWEALLDEADEETAREQEKRKMKV